MATLTAPGIEGLPWDRAKCRHSAAVKCSGTLGCVAESAALDRLFADLEKNVRRLLRAAKGDQVAEQLRRMLIRAPNSRIVRCSPALTRCSGLTMRNLRLKRWAWAITGGQAMSCSDAAALHRTYREYREQERMKHLALL